MAADGREAAPAGGAGGSGRGGGDASSEETRKVVYIDMDGTAVIDAVDHNKLTGFPDVSGQGQQLFSHSSSSA